MVRVPSTNVRLRLACAAVCAMGIVAGPLPAQTEERGTDENRPPRVINADEVSDAVRQYYPVQLRKRGVAGVTRVKVFVSERGMPDKVQVVAKSGARELDRAALTIARAMRFSPAESADGVPRGVWVELPIKFDAPPPIPSPADQSIALANPEEIERRIDERYPEAARAAGVAGEVRVWIQIDSTGVVVDAAVDQSSCISEFDETAYDIAYDLRFEPVRSSDTAIGGWTIAHVYFGLERGGVLLDGESIWDADRAVSGEPIDVTQPKPGMTRPELTNTRHVQYLLTTHFPPRFRDNRMGGTTQISFWLDDSGAVFRRMVTAPSGHCELDLAALAVAGGMRFQPALIDGIPIKSLVRIPISFQSR